MLAEIARFLRKAAGEKLNLRTQLDPAVHRIRVEPKLAAWLFLSLGASAFETMVDSGEIDFVTSNVTLDSAEARDAGVKAGPYVQVEMTAHRGRINAGMIVRTVLEQAEGAIQIRDIAADMVVAKIILPSMVRSAAPAFGIRRNPAASAGPGRVVLIVDDDSAERELAREALEASGYEIVEARNGREAEGVLARTHVDLMITDIVMPEQDGLETIKSVRKAYPLLKIVAMSETTGGYQLRAARLLGADAILAKPLTHGLVGDVVRTQLGPR